MGSNDRPRILFAAAPRLPVVLLVAAWPLMFASAHAQSVYKCRIAGNPVFQSSPCAPEPVAALVVAPAPPVDPASAPKKKSLAEILHERDAGDPPKSREVQRDGAAVLRSRMGAV